MPESHGLLLFDAPTLVPDDFAALRDRGFDVSPPVRTERGFTLAVAHPAWGSARLTAGEPGGNLGALIDTVTATDGQLTDADSTAFRRARGSVAITHASSAHVAMARKYFLRFARAALGVRGLGVIDLLARRGWSRELLDIEMAIDAEVDVSALFIQHSIAGAEESVQWLHTHGLAEAGGFDLDIVEPDGAFLNSRQDTLRALAFAVLEGRAQIGYAPFTLAWPQGDVVLVPVDAFMERTAPELAALRTDDDDHRGLRAVVCEPPMSPFGAMSPHLVPALFTSGAEPAGSVVGFSVAAGERMSRRARGSISILDSHMTSLDTQGWKALVKLAYEDAKGGREHLWFEAHSFRDDHIDATLMSTPRAIPSLARGQRGWHPITRLTDWVAGTPFGPARPWFVKPLRRMDE